MSQLLKPSFRKLTLAAALTLAGMLPVASADVKMPQIFGDHMVLQQAATLPVWGWAKPGEKVTVNFANQTATTTAGADGARRVNLKPVVASDRGQVLRIKGDNTISFQDVVVGDVWIASGQSNMEFGLQTADGAAAAIAGANDPSLRMFFVPWVTSLTPKMDLPATSGNSLNGKWEVCTPALMKANWAWHGFSAIGYFFARDIRQQTHRPVGMIGIYKGGTAAQVWTSLDALRKSPSLVAYVDAHDKLVQNYPAASKTYPAERAKFEAEIKQWNDEFGREYGEKQANWEKAVEVAKTQGTTPPPRPVPPRPQPKAPNSPDGGFGGPANLFNGMVAPVIPYAIKGVIWYQGESNGGNIDSSVEYATLFPAMIADWREKWGQGNFPFLYVELAGFKMAGNPLRSNWPWVRESQVQTLKVPNTAMASAIDIGNPGYIHPADKIDVGHRLALAVRRVAYGESIIASGPLYSGMKIEGKTIRLSFTDCGDGLKIGTPPWSSTGVVPPVASALKGFFIAGANQQFVRANAVIDGNTVVVSADSVPEPKAVRYDWEDAPAGNLYNAENLPASTFRTDNWEPAPLENTAIVPSQGNSAWVAKFNVRVKQAQLKQAHGKQIDLVFDGDSITDWFQTNGKEVWAKEYAHRNAFDFGIAGDQTNHMLWRLGSGQMKGIDPKLVVLLIGTNNTISNSAIQIVDGIQACTDLYLKQCPKAHVLLLALFPRRKPGDPLRIKVNEVNAILAKTQFNGRVTYLNIGDQFLGDHDEIRTDLMPGLLHPNAQGYQVWADAIRPIVDQYCPTK